jgi:hypothetical protein
MVVHGPGRQLHDLGDLLMGEPLEPTQAQGFPLAGWKLLHPPLDPLGQLPADQGCVRTRCRRPGRFVALRQELLPAATVPEVVQRQVPGRSVQESPDRSRGVVILPSLPEPDEGFLDQVPGGGVVLHQPPDVSQEIVVEGPEEGFEGPFVRVHHPPEPSRMEVRRGVGSLPRLRVGGPGSGMAAMYSVRLG